LADPLQRLHGPTKATTVGIGAILIASMLYQLVGHDQFSFHEFLIALFLFITAPISAHLLAKAYLHMSRTDRE
jgi:multicomponent K+:H+ antiporter subunit G